MSKEGLLQALQPFQFQLRYQRTRADPDNIGQGIVAQLLWLTFDLVINILRVLFRPSAYCEAVRSLGLSLPPLFFSISI